MKKLFLLIIAGAVLGDIARKLISPIRPIGPIQPREDWENVCSAEPADWMTQDDIEVYLEGLSVFQRMVLMQSLNEKFCTRCGGNNGAGLGCDCAARSARHAQRGLEIAGGRS